MYCFLQNQMIEECDEDDFFKFGRKDVWRN